MGVYYTIVVVRNPRNSIGCSGRDEAQTLKGLWFFWGFRVFGLAWRVRFSRFSMHSFIFKMGVKGFMKQIFLGFAGFDKGSSKGFQGGLGLWEVTIAILAY